MGQFPALKAKDLQKTVESGDRSHIIRCSRIGSALKPTEYPQIPFVKLSPSVGLDCFEFILLQNDISRFEPFWV